MSWPSQPQPARLRDNSSKTNICLTDRTLDSAIPPPGTDRPTHPTGHKGLVGLAEKTAYIVRAWQDVATTPPRREHSDGLWIKQLAPNPRLVRAGRPVVRNLERSSPGLRTTRTVENLDPTGAL